VKEQHMTDSQRTLIAVLLDRSAAKGGANK
jgi:hypothetical protein